MNHLKWVAWGVVDIENMDNTTGSNGQARRSYLRKVHAELKDKGVALHPGGSKQVPWYAATFADGTKQTAAGPEAFKKICGYILEKLGEHRDAGVETVADKECPALADPGDET